MPARASSCFRYGLHWPSDYDDLQIEFFMLRSGGQWTDDKDQSFGEGFLAHFIHAQELLWPQKVWHKWNLLETECYVIHRCIAELGAASSGKSYSAACNVLTDYYLWPDCTTVLVASTEKEMLEMRIWGEVKALHKAAKRLWPDLPGQLIEGRQRIVTDERDEVGEEGRDFRNGVTGVPCKKGETWVFQSAFSGVKNKHVRVVFDEASMLPQGVVDVVANLGKNPDFKCVVLGNPMRTTDALGRMSEPAEHLGGWEGGVDQSGLTKTWPTRFDGGVAIQLVGTDSPNLDGKLGIPLITQRHIDADLRFYGPDSLQFTSMNAARMPRGEGSRRVLTRALCVEHGAFSSPVWRGDGLTHVGFLDAAYGSTGGDRCIFGQLTFGPDTNNTQILALIETVLVPVSVRLERTPEDQIVHWVRTACESRGIVPANFFYDAGMRTSLVMAFSRLWSTSCQAVDCGGPPTERPVDTTLFVKEKSNRRLKTCREHYSKFVTELWFSVRYAIEANQWRGMSEDALLEFSQREWGYATGNRIEVEPKADMRRRTGRSPDIADAIAIGLEGARQRGFVISRLEPETEPEQDYIWKERLRERATSLRTSYTLDYSYH